MKRILYLVLCMMVLFSSLPVAKVLAEEPTVIEVLPYTDFTDGVMLKNDATNTGEGHWLGIDGGKMYLKDGSLLLTSSSAGGFGPAFTLTSLLQKSDAFDTSRYQPGAAYQTFCRGYTRVMTMRLTLHEAAEGEFLSVIAAGSASAAQLAVDYNIASFLALTKAEEGEGYCVKINSFTENGSLHAYGYPELTSEVLKTWPTAERWSNVPMGQYVTVSLVMRSNGAADYVDIYIDGALGASNICFDKTTAPDATNVRRPSQATMMRFRAYSAGTLCGAVDDVAYYAADKNDTASVEEKPTLEITDVMPYNGGCVVSFSAPIHNGVRSGLSINGQKVSYNNTAICEDQKSVFINKADCSENLTVKLDAGVRNLFGGQSAEQEFSYTANPVKTQILPYADFSSSQPAEIISGIGVPQTLENGKWKFSISDNQNSYGRVSLGETVTNAISSGTTDYHIYISARTEISGTSGSSAAMITLLNGTAGTLNRLVFHHTNNNTISAAVNSGASGAAWLINSNGLNANIATQIPCAPQQQLSWVIVIDGKGDNATARYYCNEELVAQRKFDNMRQAASVQFSLQGEITGGEATAYFDDVEIYAVTAGTQPVTAETSAEGDTVMVRYSVPVRAGDASVKLAGKRAEFSILPDGATLSMTGNSTEQLFVAGVKDDYFGNAVAAITGSVPTPLLAVTDFEEDGYQAGTISEEDKILTATDGAAAAIVTSETPLRGTKTLALTGLHSEESGLLLDDILNGKATASDAGRTFKISAWVYPAAEADTATITMALGAADDASYIYRTCSVNRKEYTIASNEWSEISLHYTITEEMLDNGSTSSNSNPIVSALKIDQCGAAELAASLYIDDISVEELTASSLAFSTAIGDHMVYQMDEAINVWGTSTLPDDTPVTVTLKAASGDPVEKTASVSNGMWKAEFPPMTAQTGITITARAGEESITVSDVAVGMVLLASGQSNMQFSLDKTADAEEYTSKIKDRTGVRIMTVQRSGESALSQTPAVNPYGANWSCGDEYTANKTSAIGYITACKLYDDTNIPVGVIDINLNGSSISAWESPEVIRSRPDQYQTLIDRLSQEPETEHKWKSYPTGLFNSLIRPLENYKIGAVLWYQGEGDSGSQSSVNAYQYLLYDLISMWRAHFGNEELPVVLCQLAPYGGSDASYIRDLRQVQLDTHKRMEHVYLVTTCDLGPTGQMTESNENLIHPVRKVPVADRIYKTLAANVEELKQISSFDGEYSGPEYEYMQVNGSQAVLYFSHADGLKTSDGADLKGFEVSANGTEYVPATAVINSDDNTVTVSADSVANPKYVRYCYVGWAVEDGEDYGSTLGGNLVNGADLPAGPFLASVANYTLEEAEIENNGQDGVNVNVTLRNNAYCKSEDGQKVIAGVYESGSDRLIYADFDSTAAALNTKSYGTLGLQQITIPIPAAAVSGEYTVRLFVWNVDSLVPLGEVLSVKSASISE